ncbi:alpha/beta fold hydrolase [Pseudoalteromonas ruthenica]|uniref:alpha/beta fold hydrolase n=1 Tax=Pseudoalteromonas ruthenica TaxID=151081 RepID=UPI00110BE135|nr:alpha/beta fold hydrolase [Pseudoalteromonas ruthenica]TMO47907.1 esterase [Pseudoalteromonas ruthenica]TMO52808.1 esterase [Pseudoalteromonas ruthenica]
MSDIIQQSIYIDYSEQQTLHLRYIAQDNATGPAIFFMHGAVENGKIFYTHSNKGLAPFLAKHGYRCYVADLCGRGESKPSIGPGASYGQTEAICHEIPAFLSKITEHAGEFPRFWVAHSWGGVLFNSVFARFPEYIKKVSACAYFGSKRSLYNRHPSKFLKGNLVWYWLAPKKAKKYGYLPARKLKWGSDDETVKSHFQSMQWAKVKPWIDSDDGFDYGHAIKRLALPPTLHIAGVKDKALAQPIDIKKFMQESGCGIQEFKLYGRSHGHHHDYGHIDMLTHPQAQRDQFQDVLAWFSRYG